MKSKTKKILLPFAGIFIGFVNGFFGGGGGMLLVPTLRFLGGLDQKKSQATALSIILPIAVISAFIYTIKGAFNFPIGLSVTSGVVSGGIIGACILNKIPNKMLSIIFYIVMLVAGFKMLFS